MSDGDQKISQTLVQKVLGWIPVLHRWLWPTIAFTFAVLFTLVVIQPFGRGPTPAEDSVEKAWIESIGRLGILPVYPPSEDIHVGDLWGVVAEAEDTLLLNKAVRLAHIDLRNEITSDAPGPVFADTAELAQGHTFRHQKTGEVLAKGDQISLSLAAFPGVVISHSTKASGSAGFGFGLFSGSREDDETEEIRIPTAETYGAPIVASFARLDEFCSNPQTSLYCSDEFVRRAIAYATGARVLATLNGQYRAKLQISLVVRTFATREIQQSRVRKDNRGGQVAASARPMAAGSVAGASTIPTESGVETPPAAGTAKGNNQGSAAINLLRGNEAQIQLQQVFERPVVFGFRAITISLALSAPRQEAPQ